MKYWNIIKDEMINNLIFSGGVMNLKVGDTVTVHVQHEGHSVFPNDPASTGKCNGECIDFSNDNSLALVAWRYGKSYPNQAKKLNYDDYPIPYNLGYRHALWVDVRKLTTDAMPQAIMDNVVCKVCKEPNQYAVSNQSDGSFICYSCRS